ncbi:uncharacterized protein LOC127749456 [Frankliniella occidentalis]|uniref:Uncharacterized protein LOC127749456 n=1 Tax=Frankliniella occidentalis TaxID=133901 RepID=A0A9C6WW15_FRAOC|nr:uncharacterized protein LOC127749456 [Frankliniella occidentalis]
MASLLHLDVDVKNEIFEDSENLPLVSSLDITDSYDEVKVDLLNDMKEEDTTTTNPQPDSFCFNNCCCFEYTPASFPRPPVKTHLARRRVFSRQESGVWRDLVIVRKLLQTTLPKKHVGSRWTKLTTESIMRFLKSFLSMARSSRLTHCASVCLSLNGPRILKCEVCFLEFSGLYDRYLKLFTHYKNSHKLKCNVLIGQKWIKQKASLEVMVDAWKLDLKYELQNSCCIGELSLV